MITLVYSVEIKDAKDEKAWLNDMKVYPAIEDYYDWNKARMFTRFCAIVSPDTALSIKLRHPLQLQQDYFQR